MKRLANMADKDAIVSGSGFTLMEMLLVLGILSLISAVTFPALWSWLEQNQLSQSVESFVLTLSRASAQAANEGIPHAVEFLPNGQRYRTVRLDSQFDQDVEIWETLTGECMFEVPEQKHQPLPRGEANNSCRLWFHADGRCTSYSLEIRSGRRRRIVDLEGTTGQARIRQESS
jgi:prepilin-type N-terminal cleavage/methylation domain-containing protein